ncbi:alpha-1,4-N-acetylglucosaminyltransferase [Vombatus ursinus]|uniref:Alpha-1,4-N-acetylglucosaminyltransferase n=1 Tax=Vombatus ursinus TaxID=29139 RepID=A0A4X2KPX1_VOMUR|nr:alpha-1,4-N-acetylglucosaminyltransferase [Vombatus ursinus]
MLKEFQISLSIFFLFTCGFLYEMTLKPRCFFSCTPAYKAMMKPEDILRHRRNIVFLETTNRLEPSPLVSCAVESAARIYPERSIIFLMKGLDNNSTHLPLNASYPGFSLLSAIENVFFFPLVMETLLQETPLFSWYTQINSSVEKNWIHISSDACRLAFIWRYGGIYMDTDIISIRPVPEDNFLAAQTSKFSSNGVFGFHHHHSFIWDCMENFIEHYNGKIWGNQGPGLMTRMLRLSCNLTDFREVKDLRCPNLSFLHPQRFYPIAYLKWKRYYEVWDIEPSFNDSYALHLWNYMNQEKKAVIRGSNTLAENLYRKYCPITYKNLIQGKEKMDQGEPKDTLSPTPH